MVRPRKTILLNQNPPAPDLATVVANLQRQLLEQQQETNRLREQLAQINQRPQANEVPPQNNQVPPVVPPVPEVQPEGQQRNYPQKKIARGNKGNGNSYPVCTKCGRKHPGVCRMGSNACYLCGKEGHFAKNCTLITQGQNPSYPSRNTNSRLHAVQAKLEGSTITQGRIEAPEPQARIYAYTKGDAEAGTSHVVTEDRERCG
ncbi:hypothetical protein TIFTF001_044698 [Ficus carica]|uniref:CCHC-type domain-containing protein n=1 Tax=Ficus carica TaxID=3494 RepID=A0AA88CUP5_FICCA|nr:hypothetical protein TIFTF001_044698 [Ficus carica]